MLPHYHLIEFYVLTCHVQRALSRTHLHPRCFCHKCCEQRYLTSQIDKSSPAAFSLVFIICYSIIFNLTCLERSNQGMICPPSSVNQLHRSMLSTVGWVSHFSQDRSHLFCPALLSSNQRTASQSAESGLTAGTHLAGSCSNTHSTAADMMLIAFFLLLVFTGKTLCCMSMFEVCLYVWTSEKRLIIIV